MTKKGLGRGLAEVFGADPITEGATREVPIDDLSPGPWQPRQRITKENLTELTATIRQRGVLQPLLVQQGPEGFRIVAGERRWRAAKLANLTTIPVVVKEMSDRDAMFAAMIENMQREDLHVLDQATAARRIMGEMKLSVTKVSEELGMSRPALSNLLRLLELAPSARVLLEKNQLTAGHARAIVGLPKHQQEAVASRVASNGLTVRQTEQLVEKLKSAKKKKKTKKGGIDSDIVSLCNDLSERLGMRVEINPARGNKGKLVINYRSLDSLDRLIKIIQRSTK